MPEPDPRDQLWGGITALGGIADLLLEVSDRPHGHLSGTRAENLHVLLDLVEERLVAASEGFRDWQPK